MAKIDGNNAKVVIPKEDLEEFTWGQLFHFAKDSQSSNVYQQNRIEKLESEIHDMQLELNRAQSELREARSSFNMKSAEASKLLHNFSKVHAQLEEANDAIKCMNEIGVEPYDSKEHSQLKKHQKAIDRALKELDK